jgi:hypothetical protein
VTRKLLIVLAIAFSSQAAVPGQLDQPVTELIKSKLEGPKHYSG